MVEHKDNKRFDYDPVYSWSAYFTSKKDWQKTTPKFWTYFYAQTEDKQRKILDKKVSKDTMPEKMYTYYQYLHHKYTYKLSPSVS